MSQIHILDGQEDVILDFITIDKVIDDVHRKSLEDTLESYNFIALDDSYAEHLEKRNRIIIPDEDGSLVEFVIFEIDKYRDTEGKKVQTFTHASYLELKKAKVLYPESYPQRTASQHAGVALSDTGWTVGIIESNRARQMSISEHSNPYAFLKHIAKEFELELNFRVEHDGNKITGRYVDLLERIGQWRGREFEFGTDLDGIRRVEKQDIVTALLGLGPEDEDGKRLEVLVEDDDALKRWGRIDDYGNLHHLIEPYEIQSERTEMTESEARRYTRTALNKRINTQITYEADVVDLADVLGMDHKEIRFGDTIRIKDTSFNPPLYLEARIFAQDRSIKRKAKKNLKLGDYIEYTEEEVNAIWKQLQKDIQKRVTAAEMAEYTYSKMLIDQKDEQVYEDGKTFAEATGVTAEENAKAYAVEQDAKIKVDVQDYADSVAEQQAESALSQAKQYAVAKEVYENQMDRIASDIEDRAPLEYVDGEFKFIKDDLDKFDAELEKKADGSTVYTISEVDNMINNTVSKTEYTTDMEGIVTDLESHGTRIGQNEEAIGLKADESYVDTVENSLSTKIGNVEVTAEGAKMSASEVRADLDNRTTIHDTRDDNEPPSYYWDKYSKETIHEFKRRTTLGITSGETYGILTTVIPWSDPSGGLIKQTFKLNSKTFERTSISRTDDDWTKWIEIENTEDAQKRVDSAVTVLDASIETLAGEVSLKASQSIVDSLENQVENHEAELNVLPGQIELKADAAVVDGIDDRLGSAEVIIDGLESEITLKADKVDIEGMLTADDLAVRKELRIGENLRLRDGKMEIVRPDGAVSMSDGMVSESRSIGGINPMFMGVEVLDLGGTVDERVRESAFVEMQGYYTKVVGRLDGRGVPGAGGSYFDIRDGDYRSSVRVQRYYFTHSTRYVILTYRSATTNIKDFYQQGDMHRHLALIYDNNDNKLVDHNVPANTTETVELVADLGVPDYKNKWIDFRIGWAAGWGNREDYIRFRINDVVQTDFK